MKQETDIPHSNLSVYHPRSFVILLHQAMQVTLTCSELKLYDNDNTFVQFFICIVEF